MREINYCIFDPTGNITALVESEVKICRQPEIAAMIMKRHPEVEQVGFTAYGNETDGINGSLRMAGGEFCGNASMSAAALCLIRQESFGDPEAVVHLKVSGSRQPVKVHLNRKSEGEYTAGIQMPKALSIEERKFFCVNGSSSFSGFLPIVLMEGISHIIIESGSPFFSLLQNRKKAEEAVRRWCAEQKADGLGLMFLQSLAQDSCGDSCGLRPEGDVQGYHLTPLVCIPGGDTVFWENSCASGTAAAAMYLAKKTERKQRLALKEPGGILRAESEPALGETWLYGRTLLVGEYKLTSEDT